MNMAILRYMKNSEIRSLLKSLETKNQISYKIRDLQYIGDQYRMIASYLENREKYMTKHELITNSSLLD